MDSLCGAQCPGEDVPWCQDTAFSMTQKPVTEKDQVWCCYGIDAFSVFANVARPGRQVCNPSYLESWQ